MKIGFAGPAGLTLETYQFSEKICEISWNWSHIHSVLQVTRRQAIFAKIIVMVFTVH